MSYGKYIPAGRMAASMLDSPVAETAESGRTVYVSRDFYATMDTQLSVFCDDELHLISDSDKYWWLVRESLSGQTGYVPSDIVESVDEHVAKMNRMKNQELTRPTSNDDLSWRKPTNESDDSLGSQPEGDPLTSSVPSASSKPWSASGFARKTAGLCSAPALSKHKKTVSFSEKQPEEHRFAVDDDSVTEASISTIIATDDPHQDQVFSPAGQVNGGYDYNVDPIIEELLEREFGKPMDPMAEFREAPLYATPAPAAEANIPRYRSIEYVADLAPIPEDQSMGSTGSGKAPRPLGKNDLGPGVAATRSPQKLQRLVSRLWRAAARHQRATPAASLYKQLLRIYAGNCSAVHGYKTLLLDEDTAMAEVADMAVDKFGLHGDRFNYMLSVVHCETHEILHVAANYTLAMVIELAKRATLMEGDFVAVTDSSLAALPRRVKKRQSKSLRMSKSTLATPAPLTPGPGKGDLGHDPRSFSCIASPVVQALSELDLTRDRASDFITHYKFVLNRWLESPAPMTPFYLQVQLAVSSVTSRSNSAFSGLVPSKASNASTVIPKSPLANQVATSAGPNSSLPSTILLNMQDDGQFQSGAKMLVNTSMTVAELTRAALAALDVPLHTPGITYDLYLACRPADIRDRIYLTREMVVADILHLRPMIDPSGLTLVLQSIADSKRRS